MTIFFYFQTIGLVLLEIYSYFPFYFIFQRICLLESRMREGDIFNPLVYTPNAPISQSWARLKSGIRNSILVYQCGRQEPKHLGHHLLPSQAHWQEARLEAEHPAMEAAL